MSRWTEEQRIKALAIAQATSITDAARQTGIPRGTIGRWLAEQKRNSETETGETKRNPKKIQRLQQAALERAIEEASDYIAKRLKGLADSLYKLAEKAVKKVDVAISDPEELPKGKKAEPHDRDGAAWVKALVGVIAQSIDKAQLLSGKPTARPEVVDRHEYEITQRIIADPEAFELAEELLRRAAGRDTGSLRLHGERGPLDTL